MIDGEELKQCSKIEYDCWRENLSPMLNISEYIYYLTPTSIEDEIKSLLSTKSYHAHILMTYDAKFEIVNRMRREKRILTGFAIIRNNPYGQTEYMIDRFFIAPEYQNRGIGQKLLQEIVTNFSDRPITVSVFAQNRVAQHILLKSNFRQTVLRNSKLVYGKNEIDIQNVYYRLDRMEKDDE